MLFRNTIVVFGENSSILMLKDLLMKLDEQLKSELKKNQDKPFLTFLTYTACYKEISKLND
ncbi:hypothetical protein BpHYR1_041714 [Brachionus plicatilis]|uniref:Uncharacterized protein n=1 Tax=Brachionus plicatilis TaxID=10195 RepID=A0A3M7PWH1_BRAPC|nr:hypothetical protein BpHYR1_041714 [Brachionus plicatilis]